MTLQRFPIRDASGNCTGEWGVISDHVGGEAPWVDLNGEEVRVLCSEIVWVYSEDGRSDGRCGRPAVGVSWGGEEEFSWCGAHAPAEDPYAECQHGMSLALCAGPNHW
jgi:hypothetical protein